VLVPRVQLVSDDEGPGPGEGTQEQLSASASAAASDLEQLRHRDVSRMTAAEREELHRLLALMRLPGEARRIRRKSPSERGTVDTRRTLRAWMRAGGEPAALHHQRPHAAARRGSAPTEVFALGTRLTRLTREMAHRDADAAMSAVAAAVPDAGGGTRLGLLLKEFLDRWGQRGTARGAVVVILSDGWERGDVTLLAEQVARLQRLAHRVVWANPRKAAPGFAPVAAGMAAALPHVDDFVEGHSLAALEHLAAVVRGAARA
jgi:uncharacterized protein with von Willebrand factor type A (vWA) domain